MCTCNSERQLHPGLHQKKPGQQGEGGDSSTLFWWTPPGVLSPALDILVQARHEPVREEGCWMGPLEPGGEKAMGRCYLYHCNSCRGPVRTV